MTKDNQALGSFLLKNIPPGPAGREKFDCSFDIDSDGILTVTATHQGSGNTGMMEIDARTSGRLKDEEINSMVEKAEAMKLEDQSEENRVMALNRLEGLICRVKYEMPRKDSDDVGSIFERVNTSTQWIANNPSASETAINAKYFKLLEEAKASLSENFKDANLNRSTHVFEMSQMTAQFCLEKGDSFMESESEKNQEEAVVWYRKAYNIASRKGRMDKMVKASQKMGHARRLLVENGTDIKKNLETCIDAAMRLVGSLELGERHKALSKEQREVIIDDIEFVYKDFFDEINMLEGNALFTAVDWFMYAISHGERIKDTAWNTIMLRCYIHHMMLLLAFIEEEIAKENFKQAFLLLNMLTQSKGEACRLMASQTVGQSVEKLRGYSGEWSP